MDALLREAYEYYLAMKKLYSETGYDKQYKLSTFWANENQKAIHEAISSSRTAADAIHAIQRTPLYCINPEDEIKQLAIDWLLQRQRRVGIHLDQLDQAIEESPFTNPDTFAQRFGRNITPDFLRCINITEEIRGHCEIPESGMKVIELGAGAGHLARLLRLRGMARSHVITDLPETMLFSYMYLKLNYPEAKRLLITADSGGSNGYRIKLWKAELQGLADETGLEMSICHFPPGTSKWNKIEHRLFSFITQNWRGKPLVSHEVIVNLIAATTTVKGLRVQCKLDTNQYPLGIKVSDEEMELIDIEKDKFHGEWNYTISPRDTLS